MLRNWLNMKITHLLVMSLRVSCVPEYFSYDVVLRPKTDMQSVSDTE